MKNNSGGILSDEVSRLINKNARSGARYFGSRNHIDDISELESYLVTQLTTSLIKNQNMRNSAGIRYIIRKRWNNWVKREVIKRQEHEISIEHIENKMKTHLDTDNGENADVVLSEYTNNDPIKDMIEHSDIYEFLDSLTERERKVIELTAGFTESLNEEELSKVHQLVQKKTICLYCEEPECQHSFIIRFTESEVGHILGLTRRQVQYITGKESKVREKAIEFGLHP